MNKINNILIKIKIRLLKKKLLKARINKKIVTQFFIKHQIKQLLKKINN